MTRLKRSEPYRSVTFLMPEARWKVLSEIAAARGTDVSAVLNLIVTEALPDLTVWLARWKARMEKGQQ